jgi:hypothetical protein
VQRQYVGVLLASNLSQANASDETRAGCPIARCDLGLRGTAVKKVSLVTQEDRAAPGDTGNYKPGLTCKGNRMC